ncbi:MAG: hypothetical protein K2I75_03410 [Clostridiales bacterium]|nr:hypothetical protein [Clostridiales bacterium]
MFKKRLKIQNRYRFKFEKFPQLLEPYEHYNALYDKMSEYSNKNSESAGKKMWEAYNKLKEYGREVLAKFVYDAFSPIRPILHQRRGEDILCAWDDVFGSSFNELDDHQKDCLIGLFNRKHVYELPDSYYNY